MILKVAVIQSRRGLKRETYNEERKLDERKGNAVTDSLPDSATAAKMDNEGTGSGVVLHTIQGLGGSAEQKQARRDSMRSIFEVQVTAASSRPAAY